MFFKGCNIRCPWCANPEGLNSQFQVMFSHDKCINCGDCVSVCPAGIHYRAEENGEMKHFVDRNKDCIGCRKCEEDLHPERAGHYGQGRHRQRADGDHHAGLRLLYLLRGGGVTIGGGEMSLRDRFCRRLISRMQKDDD
ncbi:4Fe-4S dicluster domain-containing protein [Klebsiella pneumoniae subsp. pneumoniae]|nr:4Fe-4S dicluster domain-containing protein [Klebsiella pneumoniae subsp. pneumoniae]